MSEVVIGCRVAMPRSHWSAVPTPLFDNISQLLGDSFSVSQQPPICELPSHSSLILWLLMWLISLWSQLQCVGGWWTGGLCCTRSTSSGGGINKTLTLTMVSRLQVNNEYKIMDLDKLFSTKLDNIYKMTWCLFCICSEPGPAIEMTAEEVTCVSGDKEQRVVTRLETPDLCTQQSSSSSGR